MPPARRAASCHIEEAAMFKVRFLLACTLLVVAALNLSCAANHKQLKSITISPTTAAGQALFTATGTYSDGSKVTPLPVLWSEGNPWVTSEVVPEGIAVMGNGMASCNPVVGTFTVQGTAPVDPRMPVSQMTPMTPQVHGTARLTCP